MNGAGEGSPHALVPCVFLQHALRVKLETDDEIRTGIVIGLDQAVFSMRHGAETRSETSNSLMMVAIHTQPFETIPILKQRAGNDRDCVSIFVIVAGVSIDMLQSRPLFLLDVSEERPAANDVEQLRTAADAQDRHLFAKRVAHETKFDLVFQWMRFLEITAIGWQCFVAARFNIFAFYQQEAAHIFGVLRQVFENAVGNRNDAWNNFQMKKQFEMQLSDVIDLTNAARRSAGSDNYNRTFH